MNIAAIFQQLPSNKTVKPKGTAGRKNKSEPIHPEILKSSLNENVKMATEVPTGEDSNKEKVIKRTVKKTVTTKKPRTKKQAERLSGLRTTFAPALRSEGPSEPKKATEPKKTRTKKTKEPKKIKFKPVKLSPEQLEVQKKTTEYINNLNETKKEEIKQARENERVQWELLQKAKNEEMNKKASEAVDSFLIPEPPKLPDHMVPVRAINNKMQRNKYIMSLYINDARDRYFRGVLNEYIRNGY